MVSGLHQANRADALLARPLENGFHQLSTNRLVLHVWIQRGRTHPCNRVTFPEKVAADHTPVDLSDDGVDIGSRQQNAYEISCVGYGCDIGREAVLFGDRLEGLIADR